VLLLHKSSLQIFVTITKKEPGKPKQKIGFQAQTETANEEA